MPTALPWTGDGFLCQRVKTRCYKMVRAYGSGQYRIWFLLLLCTASWGMARVCWLMVNTDPFVAKMQKHLCSLNLTSQLFFSPTPQTHKPENTSIPNINFIPLPKILQKIRGLSCNPLKHAMFAGIDRYTWIKIRYLLRCCSSPLCFALYGWVHRVRISFRQQAVPETRYRLCCLQLLPKIQPCSLKPIK